MSAARILALAQILVAAREQETATQQELLRALRETEGVNKQGQYCYLVAPDRGVWNLSWSGGHVSVKRVQALDVQEPEQHSGMRLDDPLEF